MVMLNVLVITLEGPAINSEPSGAFADAFVESWIFIFQKFES